MVKTTFIVYYIIAHTINETMERENTFRPA